MVKSFKVSEDVDVVFQGMSGFNQQIYIRGCLLQQSLLVASWEVDALIDALKNIDTTMPIPPIKVCDDLTIPSTDGNPNGIINIEGYSRRESIAIGKWELHGLIDALIKAKGELSYVG